MAPAAKTAAGQVYTQHDEFKLKELPTGPARQTGLRTDR